MPGLAVDAPGIGLYRLRRPGASKLLYVGQKIRARLRAHLAKAARPGHLQAGQFAGEIEASWADLPGLAICNLLEHENDLIASHVLIAGYPPLAQFLGCGGGSAHNHRVLLAGQVMRIRAANDSYLWPPQRGNNLSGVQIQYA